MMSLSLTIGIVTSIVILLPTSNGVTSFRTRHCCEGFFSRDKMACSKGNISMSCNGNIILLEKKAALEQFRLVEKNGEEFLRNNKTRSIVPLNKVCSVFERNISDGGIDGPFVSNQLILICESKFDNNVGEPIELIVAAIISIVSSMLLAITAFIYFMIPQTQDVEGKCIFNLALTLGFCHFWFPYKFLVKDLGILSNLCITRSYVIMYAVLSAFSWSSVLSYHMWSRFRDKVRHDQSTLIFRYRLFGYGFPGLLILLANIHTHAVSLYQNSAWEGDCLAHQTIMIFLYALAPWIIFQLANVIFFVDLQRLLWNVHPSNSQERSESIIKKVQFKLIMNLRLFITMGSPWWIIGLCLILGWRGSVPYALDIAAYMILLVSSEGIFIFGIMVAGRKRVRKGIVDKFGIIKCGPSSDMETSLESTRSNENRNEDGQELQIRRIENGK